MIDERWTEGGRRRFGSRAGVVLLAIGVEGLLLALAWLWLGGFTVSRPHAIPYIRSVRIRWWPHPIPRSAIVRHLPTPLIRQPRVPPLPPVIRPASGLLVPVGSPTYPQLRALLRNLPSPALGAGDGSRTPEFWVDVPIPGAGGLPATGLSVVQTHYDCRMAVRGMRGMAWMEGRVNRAGQVVSARVLFHHPLPDPGWTEFRVRRWEHRVERSLRRWRFAPLVLQGHPTGFRIVLVVHYVVHLPATRIRQGRSRRFMPCVPWDFRFTGRMPRWVLYPLNGHRPLAVLLAYGGRPVPGIALATADVLRQVEKGTALEETPGIPR